MVGSEVGADIRNLIGRITALGGPSPKIIPSAGGCQWYYDQKMSPAAEWALENKKNVALERSLTGGLPGVTDAEKVIAERAQGSDNSYGSRPARPPG